MTDAQPKRPMRQNERTKDGYSRPIRRRPARPRRRYHGHSQPARHMLETDVRRVPSAACCQEEPSFRPFDPATDYRVYVDGKPRLDGVRDFSRRADCTLPKGARRPATGRYRGGARQSQERAGQQSHRGIRGAGVDGSIHFIHRLRQHGFKIAVVTSSQNCSTVLRAVRLDDAFEVQVDGNVIRDEQLAGKPAPDTFLAAANLLDIEPARAVVIEDAISVFKPGVVELRPGHRCRAQRQCG